MGAYIYTQGTRAAQSPAGLALRTEDSAVPGFTTVREVPVILS